MTLFPPKGKNVIDNAPCKNYHPFVAKAKNLICGYSWLFVAIRGYKKPSGLCENMLNYIVIPCHCVYLKIFSVFQINFLNFDPLEAQYRQNMTQLKTNQNIRARLRRKHKTLFQIAVTKSLLLKSHSCYLWLFVPRMIGNPCSMFNLPKISIFLVG